MIPGVVKALVAHVVLGDLDRLARRVTLELLLLLLQLGLLVRIILSLDLSEKVRCKCGSKHPQCTAGESGVRRLCIRLRIRGLWLGLHLRWHCLRLRLLLLLLGLFALAFVRAPPGIPSPSPREGMPAHEGGACLASSERLFLKPSEELLPPVLERPTTRKAAEPRIRGKDYYKRKREARKERKHPAKHEAERTRQRRHSWDDQYNNWHEDEEEEAPEVHDSGSEPNETDEERSDSELNLFSAPPNASFGEPHVVEERDGWKRIVVNLDTGAAATAIPSDLSLEGHAKTPPQDISYKTASAESCPSRDGRQWELKDFGRPGHRRSLTAPWFRERRWRSITTLRSEPVADC